MIVKYFGLSFRVYLFDVDCFRSAISITFFLSAFCVQKCLFYFAVCQSADSNANGEACSFMY